MWLSTVTGALLIFFLSTHITNAGWFDIGDIASGVIANIAFVVSYIMAIIAGVVVALEAWLIEVILNLNDQIFQTAFVQSGFSIALSIANLAFVLGIIVIAIATIIRSESYGIKKLLWKLVVAAILVNFGLVIAAPIFGVADSFTHYFLNCISPTAGGCSQNFNGIESYDSFATTFAGAFQPQNSLAAMGINGASSQTNITQALNGLNLDGLDGAFSTDQTNFGGALAAVVGIVFTAINLLLVVGVLAGFLILMFIRYVYIAILAVLMPFAWAAWVFPGFEKHWSKWWDKFLKWTFFAPLALFFVYLAMLLMQTANGTTGATAGSLALSQYQNTSNSTIFSAINNFGQQTNQAGGLAGFLSPIMGSLLQELIFAGLIVGGLFAAEKMGIEGSKAVTGGISHLSGKVKDYTSKKAHKTASSMIPDRVKNKLQAGQYRILPKRLQVAAGVGMSQYQHSAHEKYMEGYKKNADELAKDPEAFNNLAKEASGKFGTGALSKNQQVAMLQKLTSDEDLQKALMKQQKVKSLSQLQFGGGNLQEFVEKNQTELEHAMGKKDFGTLSDKTGLSIKKAADESKAARATVLKYGGDAHMQELKEIVDKKGVGLTPSEQRKFNDYNARINELKAKKTLSTEEQTELTRLEGVKTATAPYITSGDLATYKAAKEVFDEKLEKVRTLADKNPEVLTEYFQDFNKLSKLSPANVPLTLKPGTREDIQEAIITAMAEGFSPQRMNDFAKTIANQKNAQYFEDATGTIGTTKMDQIRALAQTNSALVRTLRNSTGKELVDMNAMFGINSRKK